MFVFVNLSIYLSVYHLSDLSRRQVKENRQVYLSIYLFAYLSIYRLVTPQVFPPLNTNRFIENPPPPRTQPIPCPNH